MKIIKITKNHINDWLFLRHKLWDYHTQSYLLKEIYDIIPNLNINYIVFIAFINNFPVGFVELSIKNKIYGFVEGIYVEKYFRNQNVAKKLIYNCENLLNKNNINIIMSDTNSKYPISPHFHKSLDFIEYEKYKFIKTIKKHP